MKVSELMSRDVELVSPGDSVQDAARRMKDGDVGALPVGDADKLIGMITDRDIAIRVVAEGRGGDTPVSEAMTADLVAAREDDSVEDAADQMADAQVRRLPVVGGDGQLVGIISLADIARVGESAAEEALESITEVGGEHNS